MTPRDGLTPARPEARDDNPTLAELTWAGVKRLARAARRAASAVHANSARTAPAQPTQTTSATAPSTQFVPAQTASTPILATRPARAARGWTFAALAAWLGHGPERRLRRQRGRRVGIGRRGARQTWRSAGLTAALAASVAAALPFALIMGGNATTFALWYDTDTVAAAAIRAGNIEWNSTTNDWATWRQTVAAGVPGGLPPAGQSGCVRDPDPATCDELEGALLDDFTAMPGDEIELQGTFTTTLVGDNIAAILYVDWDTPTANWPPSGVTATYKLEARDIDQIGSSFQVVALSLALGQDYRLFTKSNGYTAADGAGALEMPAGFPGIHQGSNLEWRVTVTIAFLDESGSSPAYPYAWDDPLDPQGLDAFVIPAVTWTFDQVRAGEKWGVPVP